MLTHLTTIINMKTNQKHFFRWLIRKTFYPQDWINKGISTSDLQITDIPAGSEANLTIYCTNMANTHQGTNFSYNLVITERTNDKGLEILMDGVPVNGQEYIFIMVKK